MRMSMDRIDEQIIMILQENARTPLKALAEKIFLSSPAVASRIERLERDGIIKGYHAQIDWQKLGYHITAYVNIEVEPVQKKDFYPYVESCPNVIECSCVTGQYSMLLKVRFHSTQELDAFIGEVGRFGRTSTQIVFSEAVEHRGVKLTPTEKKK